jgi:WD40 repeat protein
MNKANIISQSKTRLIFSFLSFLLVISSCNPKEEVKNQLKGPYLGQTLPDSIPQLFAPNIISTGMYTRDIAMTPDGNEIYYCISVGNFAYATILKVKNENGIWSEPEVMKYMENPEIMNIEPAISPDGKKFFFLSNRIDSIAGDSAIGDQDIWVMDRVDDDWSEPYNLGEPVNSSSPEFFPSVTNKGTIYFSRADPVTRIHYIFRSKFVDGKYQEPKKLPEQVNSGHSQFNAFVAPDESYIIVPTIGREDSYGRTDYYISFRNEADEWTEAINMGDKINSANNHEWSPYVSPDGKYFFFMAAKLPDSKPNKLTYKLLQSIYNAPQNGNADIYWISSKIIDDLEEKAFN